jgi:exonuclease SbcC
VLTKLRVVNFQAHGKLAVDFSPGVTCLVGKTDAGKSAVLRALRFVCLNQPQGVEFIKRGKRECSVTLEFDGRVLKRVRGKSTNYYELDGKKFQAFGAGVPPEIAEALRLSEMNFQGQFDGPFWLGDPAPKVARELNQVVDLGLIDDALSAAASSVRSARVELELTEKRRAEASARVTDTEFVPEFREDVEEVRRLRGVLAGLAGGRDALARAVAQVKLLARAASSAAPDVSACEGAARRLSGLTKERDALWGSLESVRRLTRSASESARRAADAEAMLKAAAASCPACGRPLG